MGQPTAEKIAQRAFDLGLLSERQLREMWAALGSHSVPVDDLLLFLVRRELMTNYQVERLMKGERSGFFFGDYKVLYLVGTGTFARVYRAVHRETGQVVAVKVLRKHFSDSPAQYGQFVREGRVGCTLRHPNVVPIYEVVSEGNTHFLVMEFVEGRNLREFIKIRKKFDPLEATRLLIDITDGLRYAFEHGLTHRDLKTSNVLISSTGRAKLVDFGLAAIDENATDELLEDSPNTRTIDYAALERATGVRKDDTRSDIYFLGCIYYHMLTGVPPLSETTDRLARLSKSRFQEVVPIRKLDPAIPDAVALVVNKAMSLDPKRRYQTPAAMLADLEIAARRLRNESSPDGEAARGARGGNRGAAGPPELHHSVMVVEANTQLQETLRDGLRRAGYRVLLTADPARALNRFRQDATAAECIVFNAQEVGEAALHCFNELGEDKKTHFIPAVLLLDATQREWQREANTADHRVVLAMPITMKQLRQTLGRLLATTAQP